MSGSFAAEAEGFWPAGRLAIQQFQLSLKAYHVLTRVIVFQTRCPRAEVQDLFYAGAMVRGGFIGYQPMSRHKKDKQKGVIG